MTHSAGRWHNSELDPSAGVSIKGCAFNLNTTSDSTALVDMITTQRPLLYLELEGNTLGMEAAKEIEKALESKQEFVAAFWKDLFTGRLKTEIPTTFTTLWNDKKAKYEASMSNYQKSYKERKEEIKRSEWEAKSKCNVLNEDISRLGSEKDSIIASEEKQKKEIKSKREELALTIQELHETRLLELFHVRMVKTLFKYKDDEFKEFIKDKC